MAEHRKSKSTGGFYRSDWSPCKLTRPIWCMMDLANLNIPTGRSRNTISYIDVPETMNRKSRINFGSTRLRNATAPQFVEVGQLRTTSVLALYRCTAPLPDLLATLSWCWHSPSAAWPAPRGWECFCHSQVLCNIFAQLMSL